MANEKIELINPQYSEWEGSRRGPCMCWYGAGCKARATYVATDGKEYVIEYAREFPYGTQYAVGIEGGQATTYTSLKDAANSPHVAAFRALHVFVVSQRK